MATEKDHGGFAQVGFLSQGTVADVPTVREESRAWFALADDTNAALVKTSFDAVAEVKSSVMSPDAIAVRVLLRACGSLQSVIILSERGMISEGRILARSLIEDALAIAALVDQPEKFIEMLEEDSNSSRRRQVDFLLSRGMLEDGPKRDKLKQYYRDIRKDGIISPKALAEMGSLVRLYLAYQRLSDGAAHTSARALHRHVHLHPEGGWCFKLGPGNGGEVAATLQVAITAALPLGIGVTQILKDNRNNRVLAGLAERVPSLPRTPSI